PARRGEASAFRSREGLQKQCRDPVRTNSPKCTGAPVGKTVSLRHRLPALARCPDWHKRFLRNLGLCRLWISAGHARPPSLSEAQFLPPTEPSKLHSDLNASKQNKSTCRRATNSGNGSHTHPE